MKKLLTAWVLLTILLTFLLTGAGNAQGVQMPRITAAVNSDSTYNVEIVQVGEVPQSVTRYPSLSQSDAIAIVSSWVEKQARARAAAQYNLLLAQLGEQQAVKDAEALGINDPQKTVEKIVLPGFQGRWVYRSPNGEIRFLTIGPDAEVEGLEQEGNIRARSSYEFTLESGGASLRFVSTDGKIYAALFNNDLHIMERVKDAGSQ